MSSANASGHDSNQPAADPAAAGGPPPPPASPPPPPPPFAPPRPAGDPHPDVPPAASAEPVGVDVRVSKRLLWIGEAYYPLRNIARVYTLTIHPRRKEAVLRFLKRLLITGFLVTLLLLLAAFMEASASSGFSGGSSDSSGASVLATFAVIIGIGANVYFFVDMMKVLGAPPRFVLAVETSGASTAVIGGPPEGRLRQLAHQISDAIENPAAEFEVRIETLTVNPQHYYFGDNVNMYGGTGNVGVRS